MFVLYTSFPRKNCTSCYGYLNYIGHKNDNDKKLFKAVIIFFSFKQKSNFKDLAHFKET